MNNFVPLSQARTDMNIIRKTILSAGMLLLFAMLSPAQVRTGGDITQIDGIVEFDKTVHDFGDFLLSAGPQACIYKVKNISERAIAILTVTSSCGCTDVKWTKSPLKPGETGTISATYSNDQGAYPFEKNLTVYISSLSKPVILRIRGNVLDKKKPLAEIYPVHLGSAIALKDSVLKAGNLSQGGQRSDFTLVANISRSPVNLSFKDVSPGLDIRFEKESAAPGQTVRMMYTVTADRSRWGKNWYYATPVVNGKAVEPIKIWAFTKEDFSHWTKDMIKNGSQPMFESSTYEFGIVKSGTVVEARFRMSNKGKSELRIYKVDSDTPGVADTAISPLEAGGGETLKIKFDTAGLPKGETVAIITLTTNSPIRPIVNLFISGAIK